MTTTGVRTNPMAPPLPPLTAQAELALLCRVLHRDGYDSHLAGHITYRQPDDTLLVNPYGLTWDEVRASDIMRIDGDGAVLGGPWTVTPAIPLHLELHKVRRDIRVAIHNHPRWGTIWADAHRAPPVYDQSGAGGFGDPAIYDEWQGTVAETYNARACVDAMGDAPTALLGNHGVVVVGVDVEQACHRAVVLEWRARQAWHVEVLGGGKPIPREILDHFSAQRADRPTPGVWEAMARRELRLDPTILD
jgi:ribulose-5-phosphate 4-epimerase/fuculose-1-phosphate aldolase